MITVQQGMITVNITDTTTDVMITVQQMCKDYCTTQGMITIQQI